MDIQYCAEISSILDAYISNYLTKAERYELNELWNAINKENGLKSALKQFALAIFKNREIGAMEWKQHILLGYSNYGFSVHVKKLNCYMSELRTRKLKNNKMYENKSQIQLIYMQII